ncbi:MAG: c-type cytochrome [Anaerolineae bacterium]|nr:c-type cytochrome [Anaerolineae bacterium]
MKNIFKWIGIILGSVIVLVALAALALSVAGERRLNKTHDDIRAETIIIPTDDTAVARGDHLVHVACTSCHGPDLTGQAMINDPSIGTVYAANLTGLAETHTEADLVRAIRHGLDTDGRQLMIMPAEVFIYFSEEDLASIIAYLKTLPQQGNETPKPALTLLGRMLVGAGQFGNVFPAEYINHDLPFPEMPTVGANEAYGHYLAGLCRSCHGTELAGGQPGEPDAPPAPNLTPGGELQGWTEEDFITAMRTGMIPNGRQLDPMFMPWQSVGKLDDDELRALWLYLASLPPQQSAVK